MNLKILSTILTTWRVWWIWSFKITIYLGGTWGLFFFDMFHFVNCSGIWHLAFLSFQVWCLGLTSVPVLVSCAFWGRLPLRSALFICCKCIDSRSLQKPAQSIKSYANGNGSILTIYSMLVLLDNHQCMVLFHWLTHVWCVTGRMLVDLMSQVEHNSHSLFVTLCLFRFIHIFCSIVLDFTLATSCSYM